MRPRRESAKASQSILTTPTSEPEANECSDAQRERVKHSRDSAERDPFNVRGRSHYITQYNVGQRFTDARCRKLLSGQDRSARL
jgi:hypothetical protein